MRQSLVAGLHDAPSVGWGSCRPDTQAETGIVLVVLLAGGHFKSNKSTGLPEGSFRTTKKGYDEVGSGWWLLGVTAEKRQESLVDAC
jgi:hypothetical protein